MIPRVLNWEIKPINVFVRHCFAKGSPTKRILYIQMKSTEARHPHSKCWSCYPLNPVNLKQSFNPQEPKVCLETPANDSTYFKVSKANRTSPLDY